MIYKTLHFRIHTTERRTNMKRSTFKRTFAVSTLGLATLLAFGGTADAQVRNQGQQNRTASSKKQSQQPVEQKRPVVNTPPIIPQNRKVGQQTNRNVRANQTQIQREQQIRLEKSRQAQLELQRKYNAQYNNRYRVVRNGSYYETDYRGAELLREAVNKGYQQGFIAGRDDRSRRRGNSYSNSSIYSNGNYGYQSYVDSRQYQFYFQQGFERGYQDGYNSRNRFGSNNNGQRNILAAVLKEILNIESF